MTPITMTLPNKKLNEFISSSDQKPLHWSRKNSIISKDQTDTTPSNTKFHVDPLGICIGLAIGAVLMLAGFIIFKFCFKSRKNNIQVSPNTNNVTLFSIDIQHAEDLSFLINAKDEDLQLEIIGKGGCGEVYKTELPRRGGGKLSVAIKKIALSSTVDVSRLCRGTSNALGHRTRQVRAEILTVGRVGHPNLLRLLAHVSNQEKHFLISEFMQNGSLQDALRQRQLKWPVRYKIALGIATGLEYLHFLHKPCIIHRDLKPGNILLDRDMNPRIADFGLAKAAPGGSVGMTRVVGTLGYIAPEYYNRMPCTDRCDVYSFGVILAVLVSGRFPSDSRLAEMGMVKWLRKVMSSSDSDGANEGIDEILLGTGYEKQMLLALKIAYFCTRDNPEDRPCSRDVRRMLEQIKH